jgi:hypothetical protein
VGKHSFPLAVGCSRVSPKLLKICCHREEPFADRVVQDDLILVSRTLPFLSCLGQQTQLLIPVCLECIGDKAITGIDHHETALRQIRCDLSLEICALADTLILDEDGVYDPTHFNDRLKPVPVRIVPGQA